jgi:hypothetical protein
MYESDHIFADCNYSNDRHSHEIGGQGLLSRFRRDTSSGIDEERPATLRRIRSLIVLTLSFTGELICMRE